MRIKSTLRAFVNLLPHLLHHRFYLSPARWLIGEVVLDITVDGADRQFNLGAD